jgi:hypothetical protein
MKSITFLVVLMMAFVVAACGGSVDTVDGKTADQWKTEAVAAQQDLAKAKEAVKAQEEVSSVADALRITNSPCFKFSPTESGRKQQEKACENWAAKFAKAVEVQASANRKNREAARKALWKEFPELMTKYVAWKDKQVYTDAYTEAAGQVEQLKKNNPRFAAMLDESETYPDSPESKFKDSLYFIRQAHEAVGKYVAAAGHAPE